ncbi:uncharacterized protein LOC100835630 isoform X3 [Brachypodium distachyon]|uniref:uncharacterized protein LOC100835630 isoform X3 n=1 Tax=Brachypodium distachyon TaxID=15368 RepID=UPI00052FF905|nr:uncharacterized protein LOC100835630 isoform X3 [Brachypodium distachyon]|eukprot:XP_010232391.1 uncharacterized protein LOC100835630 isoform X3 [Brachypodium distachyon]
MCKEERLRADSAEAARETESDARDALEKEIIELKAQNSALQQKQNISRNDDELLRISELEEENRQLKQVLGEERTKIDSVKKKVDEERSKALEMQKLLKSEAHKHEEYKRLADTERKVAHDWKASLEKLRIEANGTKAQLATQIQKTGEAHKMAEAERQKAAREKKCADSEKMLAEKNKRQIEVERKKVMEEKSRADNLFAKLEDQTKLNDNLRVSIEAEKEKLMCEKNRADHLLQKFEEERKRSEYLQRKCDSFSSSRDMISVVNHGIQQADVANERANIKLLKEKLKRKKEQLQHVKKVLELDKALMRRELQLLKQEWMQPLSRFNMLDDYLADGAKGIDVLKKSKRQQELHDFEQNLLPHNPVAGPYFGIQAGGMIPFTSTPREYASYQLPRESCTRPISGTSSELEPPIGSALRMKSKNHPRSSCPTSISDKKFMGSQGKESLLVSSTGIRTNQSSVVPELPPKDFNGARKQDVVLLDSSGNSSQQNASKPSLPGGTEVADQMPNDGRKRKRTKKSVESAALSSKRNLLNSKKIKTHDASTNGNLAFNDNCSSLQQEHNIIACVNEGLQNNQRKCHIVADRFPSSKLPSPGAGNACASLLSFEKLIEGGCLKLLDLDNDADEEKYRKAMEKPISPDLPIVTKGSISRHSGNGNDFEYDRVCPALEVEESANVSATASLNCLPHGNEAPYAVSSLAVESDNTIRPLFSGSSCGGHTNAILHLHKGAPDKNRPVQICDGSSDAGLRRYAGTSKAQTAEVINLTSDSVTGHCHAAENNTLYFVGVVSLKRSSIVKIFHYWEALISEGSKLGQDALVDGLLLERVSTEPSLLPEERVPLIFSMLLWDVHRSASDHVVDRYFASSAFSTTVKPYMEARLVFLKRDQLDVLVSLIEDFLVNKEVMVCDKLGDGNAVANKYHLDNETGIQVSTKPATIDQFTSACILLASVCLKEERVDVVLEVSYKVLQMGKRNLSWTMLALHVFGSICGDKLFFMKSCNLLMTTIRLVVLILESKDTSLCLVSSYIQSNRSTAFPSCTHCLFNKDTVSIDVFISSLLDELNLCSVLWNNHANTNETITKHSSHLGSSGLEINCGETCNISKQAKFAEDINYSAGRDLCYFTEIISLLELFGSYMSCEWTYNNVVVRLLKILESCTSEEYSAAILVLVSQLGRFFIGDVGYETKSVIELRNKLSVLIGTDFTRSRSILVQFSAVSALLSLLPLTFDKVIIRQPSALSGPSSEISEWFAQLSKENQSFARSFFT